jgi:hypothetical protein
VCCRSVARLLFVLLGAGLPAAVHGQASSATPATPASTVSAPLTLQGTCDAQGPAPAMHVQLTNTSGRPTAIVLGFLAPKGQAQVVTSISVMATRPATGADEEYLYVNPKFSLAEGPPWILSLAAGASHTLELPLKDFISGMTYATLDPFVAGGSRLVFTAQPAGTSATPVWTGRMQIVLDSCRQ